MPATESHVQRLRAFGVDPRGMSVADASAVLDRARALHKRRRARETFTPATDAQRAKAESIIERHPDLAPMLDDAPEDCAGFGWALSRLVRRARVIERLEALGVPAPA